MPGEISKLAKYIFLLFFIVTLIFGVVWFFAPEYWNSISGWPSEIASGRIVGMAVLVMAIGSILAFRASSWQQVELYVIMALLFNFLGVVGMLWNVLTMPTLPWIAWVLIGLNALFGVLYLYIYFTQKKV
ncbi:MAG: hypothetical protein C4K47_00120 [Candidatus Thorarchaeota archaeon]|nr:MAG: hypothetical protein C4K47_00120 [Candidatus Thorarchaeota archaeon]